MYRNCRLFCAAHTLGNTSPKNRSTKVTDKTFTKNWITQRLFFTGINWSIRKLARMITAIFTRVFAIISEPSKIFGSSRRFTILFQGLPCFVLRIFISLKERENKATSAPETTKDRMSRPKISTPNIVVLFKFTSSKKNIEAGWTKGWSKWMGFRETKTVIRKAGHLACLLNNDQKQKYNLSF